MRGMVRALGDCPAGLRAHLGWRGLLCLNDDALAVVRLERDADSSMTTAIVGSQMVWLALMHTPQQHNSSKSAFATARFHTKCEARSKHTTATSPAHAQQTYCRNYASACTANMLR